MSTHGIILDVEQGTDRWAEIRCGRITASRCADVIAVTKKGEGADRRDAQQSVVLVPAFQSLGDGRFLIFWPGFTASRSRLSSICGSATTLLRARTCW